MLRRDFLRFAVIGTCGAAGIAHAGEPGVRGVAIARAAVTAGDERSISLDVSADVLRDAEIASREVDADEYFAGFGMTAHDVGVARGRVTVRSTGLPDALAEVVDAGDQLLLVWDGVAYRAEVA